MKRGIDKQNSCDGKTKYSTMPKASEAVANLNERGKKRLAGYKCMFCGGYHIGHTKRKASNQEQKLKRVKKLNPADYDVKVDLSSGYCMIKNAI